MRRRRLLCPAQVLFVLSPMTGELLSGKSPLADFFGPFGFVVIAALCRAGAIREFAHRWRKRWPSPFLLGAACGIVEEALMVRSFFCPEWADLDILGRHGRWAGVNWV
jgi:hypothetical protein